MMCHALSRHGGGKVIGLKSGTVQFPDADAMPSTLQLALKKAHYEQINVQINNPADEWDHQRHWKV